AIIGEAVKRIARSTGRKVIGDVHLGDWGLQMGLVIAEYKVRHPEWACFKPDFNPETDALPEIDVAELNEVYPFASAKSKQDEAFAKEAHEVTKQLQDHHVGYYSLWKQFMKVSIEDIKKSYQKLSVDFDLWYGESDADAYVDELLEVLTQKGLLRESEGAMVVDVEEETDKAPIPPVIIKKSDNSNIYATTDLATMIQREKDFAPERMWYITDKRQALHFSQIFRCAKKAELMPKATELRHLGFGTMCGADGKPFKTRDGGVMRLSDLINTVTESAFEKLKDSEYVTGDKSDIAEKIGVAALKFGDLLNQPSKDYVFDIAKFLSFDGKTGVYLLYTITRINSILKKAGVDYDASLELNSVYTEQERDLMLTIALSGEVYGKAFEEMAPCYLCDNAYSLATAFSRFYHDNHILNEQDAKKRESWLALCLLTRRILVNHLDMLAIEYVENM
ncbi:MAG: arginine--tRNA ligase, partial [Oscillospiraceae bacterium]|nr:arginine--tRNA ligase [Oscillospiraceae bacterium]